VSRFSANPRLDSHVILLLLVGVSPATVVDYARDTASKLHIPTPVVLFTDADESNSALGWVPNYQSEAFYVKRWVATEAPEAYLHYVAAHEVCHMYHRHQWEELVSTERFAEREQEADDCVRSLVGASRWKEMLAAQKVVWKLASQRRRELLSATRGSQGKGGPVATPAGNRPSPSSSH